MNPTDEQLIALIAPLHAIATGMTKVIAGKPEANRLAVLQTVRYAGKITPSEIATALNIGQPQVTRRLQALEEEGFIEVARNPADGRSWIVTVTEPGESEIDRLTEIGMARWRRFLTDWDPDEIDELARLLTKLHGSITATHTTPTARTRS